MNWKRKLGNVLTICSITICVVFCVMAAYTDSPSAVGIPSVSILDTQVSQVEVSQVEESLLEEVPVTTPDPVEEPEPVYDGSLLKNRRPHTVKLYDIPLSEDLQIFITRKCEEYHIDPELIYAMIARESTYNPNAMGDNGRSYGLMQIQLRYVRERMDKLGCTDLLDPYDNVTVGIDLIAEYIDKGYGLEWALMAYNGGEGYAYNMRSQGYVSNYARSVIANAEAMKGGE